jgi:antitoxin CptB
MSEASETRLKRLTMRSARRGIKEMDIILGRFAADHLAAMTAPTLDTYEALLEENDHDLYQWVTGQTAAPAPFAALIGEITAHTGAATPG